MLRIALAGVTALALLVLGSSDVLAVEKTFSWTAPTEYTDGTALDPLQELERYELGCGPVAGDRSSDVRTWIQGASFQRVEDFAAGEHHCALRVRALVNDQPSEFSDWSNELTFTVAPGRPNAPTNLAATDAG